MELLFEQIISGLATVGYMIVPKFFGTDLTGQLLSENHSGFEDGRFHAAGVGRGTGHAVRNRIRTDAVDWLNPQHLSEAQAVYWQRMEELRIAINHQLFLGLISLEAHLTRFAPGGFYLPHLDQHRETGARILSTVVYLDQDWRPELGGQLRLYTDPVTGVNGPSIDIFPEAGQLVVFLAAEFWHEVRVASRARCSLTGWFRGREIDPMLC